MPKAKTRRSNRRFYRTHRTRKKRQSWHPYLTLGFFILVGAIFLWLGNTNGPTTSTPGTPGTSSEKYVLAGSPSINADFINRVLTDYHSPAQGKGQALYNLGVEYHIDPAYALAFFLEESKFGTEGIARVTHALGNIRATAGYTSYHGYRSYKTWEAGFEDWYRLIDNLYIHTWGLRTVDQIIPVYAPNSDNNNEDSYIHTVKMAVDTWHQGDIQI